MGLILDAREVIVLLIKIRRKCADSNDREMTNAIVESDKKTWFDSLKEAKKPNYKTSNYDDNWRHIGDILRVSHCTVHEYCYGTG